MVGARSVAREPSRLERTGTDFFAQAKNPYLQPTSPPD